MVSPEKATTPKVSTRISSRAGKLRSRLRARAKARPTAQSTPDHHMLPPHRDLFCHQVAGRDQEIDRNRTTHEHREHGEQDHAPA